MTAPKHNKPLANNKYFWSKKIFFIIERTTAFITGTNETDFYIYIYMYLFSPFFLKKTYTYFIQSA